MNSIVKMNSIIKQNLLTCFLVASASSVMLLAPNKAYAVCPDPVGENVEANEVGRTDSLYRMYFCKQGFSTEDMSFTPTDEQLVDLGSHTVPMGSTSATFPLGPQVDLMGFTVPGNGDFNTIESKIPKAGGAYGKQSVFNFYTAIPRLTSCLIYHPSMLRYLRANPSTFSIGAPYDSLVGDTSSDVSIAKATNVKLASRSSPTSYVLADIEFYNSNPVSSGLFLSPRDGKDGQFFVEEPTVFNPRRYCWLGVSTRIIIKSNSSNAELAGVHGVAIGVVTK